MRTCLNNVIDELLRQRKYSKPAGNNYQKVIDICKDLKRDGIGEEIVYVWAKQFSELVKTLSGAKDKKYSRQEQGDILGKATLFLKNFLNGLDPAKMRRNQ